MGVFRTVAFTAALRFDVVPPAWRALGALSRQYGAYPEHSKLYVAHCAVRVFQDEPCLSVITSTPEGRVADEEVFPNL